MTDQHSPPATGPTHGDAAADDPAAGQGDPACDVAHGAAPAPPVTRTLVAVFTSPVAGYLLRYAGDAGFRPVLVEPDPQRAGPGEPAGDGVIVAGGFDGYLDDATDVVVTDHHRPELGPVLRDALAGKTRWVGVMGNPRHPAPHIPALAALGVAETDIGRVHRPVGLNIGSHTPAEIALATLAGLIADRNGRPGGFEF
jgi:xanthine/CO dehydrogenase XdhC/CoxF family maturation factor